ncbi:hypothetical protein AB0G73_31930 [Streptomyces sp. NPDC020719]|uniref:hypothetical protein n=1 Tax=Streptomyces sp. NPDC020719 TaxID=3154896 RepID=UPI0033F187AA
MSRHPRTIAALALAAAALTTATACSPDAGDIAQRGTAQSENPAAAAVARAVAKAEKLNSFAYTMRGHEPGDQVAETIDTSGSLSVKPATLRIRTKVSAGADTQTMEFRRNSTATFLWGGGKDWLQYKTSMLADEQLRHAALFGYENEIERNPAEETGQLAAATDPTRVAGTETVGGVRTVHYSGTATLDQLRRALLGKPRDAQLRGLRLINRFTVWGARSLRLDLWVDDQDQVRQFRTRADADRPLDMTTVFTRHNQPVPFPAPPAEQVTDLTDLTPGELAKTLKQAQAS